MSDLLTRWFDDLRTRSPLRLERPIRVCGERDAHLGPRHDFARVELTIEPSEGFSIVSNVPDNPALNALNYRDHVVFGLLDVLMASGARPIRDVRVIIENAESDPVDSSSMAFRHAGRDAGQKILASLSQGRIR